MCQLILFYIFIDNRVAKITIFIKFDTNDVLFDTLFSKFSFVLQIDSIKCVQTF